jgi:integrase/recombinase XerD
MIAIAQPVAPDLPRQHVDAFLASMVDRGRPPNSVTAYGTDLTQLLAFVLPRHPTTRATWTWSRVTPFHLRAWSADLAQRGFAPSSRARKIASTRSFFHWLADQHLVPTDPAAGVPYPITRSVPPHVLTREDVARLLAAPAYRTRPAALRDRAMLAVLVVCGLRASELVGLDLDDVDLASNYVRIRGRAGRERHVPFDAPTHDALLAYNEARSLMLPQRFTEAVFLNHCGDRITRQGWWLILRAHAKAAGVAGVTPFALRHSCATRLLEDHASLDDVSTLLGHASSITTARMYPRRVRSC